MRLTSWLSALVPSSPRRLLERRVARTPRKVIGPSAESLEDRWMLTVLYVDDTLAGSSNGATVTFANGEPGQTGGLTFGTNAFSDLTPAIAAAAATGDTIMVARGTYNETATVIIDKSVSILGPQANIDARAVSALRTAGSVNEAVITGGGTLNDLLQIAASNVSINGLDLTSVTRHLISTSGTALVNAYVGYNLIHDTTSAGNVGKGIRMINISGSTAEYNDVYAIARDAGIEFSAASGGAGLGSSNGIVRFNEVHNLGFNQTTPSAIYAFSLISGTPIDITIQGNYIHNFNGNDALKVGGGSTDATMVGITGSKVIDNVIAGTVQDGITINTSNVLVSGNDVSGSASTNGAIYVQTSTSNVTVEYNSVHDNTAAIAAILVGSGSTDNLNIVVRYNSIVGNSKNFIDYRTGTAAGNTLDAGGNWFGSSATATVQAGIVTVQPNRVDFSYWLNSGVDMNLALPGFQPDLSSLTVAPSTIAPLQLGAVGRIQEAINVGTATAAITFLNGTYPSTEDVNVNKNVTITGSGSVNGKVSGSTGTIIATGTLSLGDGSTTGVNMTTNLTVGSNAVTLSDSDGANLNGTTSIGTSNAAPGTINAAGGLIIGSGGTLSGFGAVNGAVTVASGGHLAPGASPGSISTTNLTIAAGSSFDVEIGGLTAGTQYDQVTASASVDVTGATLNVSLLGFTPIAGDTFVIINNTSGSAVVGTFAGYSEGATVTVGGTSFTISYVGGTGSNDVVLTTINTGPPAAPVITSITTDTGSSSTDGNTSDQTLFFNGTAQAGSTVTVTRVGSGVIGTTTATGAGTWSFDYTGVTLPEGNYNFSATATVGILTSVDSAPFAVTIDITPPVAPGTPVLSPASDTGVQGDNITRINTPYLTGTATPGSTVLIYDGVTLLGTAIVTGSNYGFLVPTPLSNAVHSITAKTADTAGNLGSSGPLSLTINSTLAEAINLYVDDTLVITTDTGTAGLSVGDTVTFANAEPGQTTNLIFGVNAFSNLQPAVSSSENGDTIRIARGLYSQTSTVDINKSITILGPQANVDARVAGGRVDAIASEAIIDGSSAAGNLLTISASNVELNGLDFRNAAASLIRAVSGTTYTGAKIHYNLVHGATSAKGIGLEQMTNALIEYNQVYGVAQDTGIELSTGSANGTIQYNEVHDMGTATTNPAIYAFSFNNGSSSFSTADINVLIQGNHVYNFLGNDAIKVGAKSGEDRNVAGGKIYDNVVNNVAEDGITINASSVEVKRNDVSASSSSNAAIYIEYGGGNIAVANNYVHNNSTLGLQIGHGNGSVVVPHDSSTTFVTNVTVSSNSFVSNSGGNLFYYDNPNFPPEVLDASGNYWGSATLAAVKSKLGALSGGLTNIDYTYYVNTATDFDLMTAGYQPDLSSLSVVSSADSPQVGPTDRIQEAINAASVGATITVLGSSYTEDVNLNKNVTVQSTGTATPLTITGNLSGTTGTLLAQDTLSIGTNVAAGVNFSGALTIGAQTVTLLDSNGADLNGVTTVDGGNLISANGVNVGTATGSFTGRGTVSGTLHVATGANLSPGISTALNTGILNTGNLSLDAGSTYYVDLNGTTAGTTFDQTNVTGTVTLGATFSGTVGTSYFPQFHDKYIIINNDGTADPVNGTFAGMPEGFEFVIGPALFKISYAGGDGNDVELTEIAYVITYVNDNFANPVLGQDPDGAGPAHVFGGDAFATIQGGVDGVATDGLVNIYDGNYPENVTINKNVTLDGESATGTILNAPGGTGFALTGAGNDITIKDMKVTGAANAMSATGLNSLTLTDVTTTGNTSGGSVTNVTTFNYTTAGGADAITASATSLSTTGVLPFDATTLSGIANLNVSGNGGNDSFDITPATNAQATVITANGDANTDTLVFHTTGMTSPVQHLTGPGAGNFTSTSHVTAYYTGMESVQTTPPIPAVFDGSAAADNFVVKLNGANIEVYLGGVLQSSIVLTSVTSLNINGAGGNDTLLVDVSAGVPIPVGGLFFDGGPGTTDKLAVHGNDTQTVVYTPDSTTNGKGVITINGSTINFSNLEPVDFDNVGTFTLNLPNAADLVTIANDFNTVTTAGLEAPGTVPALKFSGTSGGVGFEEAHVFRTTNVTVDTTVVDGNDTITITSASNAHGNTNLTFNTGVGTDVLTVNGSTIVTGTFTATVPTVNLNNNVTAATITGTPTVVNVNNSTAQIQDGVDVAAAGATVNVAGGFTYAEAVSVAKNLSLVAVGAANANISATTGPALTSSGTTVNLTGFNATTSAATSTILVTAGSLKLRQNSIVKSGAAPGASLIATGAGVLNLGANPVAGTVDPGQNSITGSGTLVTSATAVDASGNWWGTNVQATIGGMLGANVDYSPFLNSGTDNAAATPGFQSSFNDITVHTAGPQTGPDTRITEGYETLANTGTIHVLSGTYSESVNLGAAPTDKAVTFAAGASPGQVHITGALTFTSNDTLPIELNGTNTTLFDNFTVDGLITLGNANLVVTLGYGAVPYDRFTIINNTATPPGANLVSGTFNGLPEGGIVNVGGVRLRVSYVEFHSPTSTPPTVATYGDGNDVSLTVMTPPVLVSFDVNGNLFIDGTGWNDDLTLSFTGTNQLTLIGNDVTNFTGPGTGNSQSAGPYTVTGNVTVNLGNGKDKVLIRGVGANATYDSGNLSIDLGSDDDTVTTIDTATPPIVTAGLKMTGNLSIVGGAGTDNVTLGSVTATDTLLVRDVTIDTGTGMDQTISIDRLTATRNVTLTNGGSAAQTVAMGVNAANVVTGNLVINQTASASSYTVGIHDTSVGGFLNVTNGSGSGAAAVTIDTTAAQAVNGATTITNGNNLTNVVTIVGTTGGLQLKGSIAIKNGIGTNSNGITITNITDSGNSATNLTNGASPANTITFNGAVSNTFLGLVTATNGPTTGANTITATRLSSTKGINLNNGAATVAVNASNIMTIGGAGPTDLVDVTGNLVISNGAAVTTTIGIDNLTTHGANAVGNVTINDLGTGTGGTGLTFGANAVNSISGNLQITNQSSSGLRSVVMNQTTVSGRTGVNIYEVGTGNTSLIIGNNAASTISKGLVVQDGSGSSLVNLQNLTVGNFNYTDLGGGTDTLDLGGALATPHTLNTSLFRVNGVTRIDTGAGSDTVTIGSVGTAILNDTVFIALGSGNDLLFIGANADSPALNSASKFIFDGGAGDDTFNASPLSVAEYSGSPLGKKVKSKIMNFEHLSVN